MLYAARGGRQYILSWHPAIKIPEQPGKPAFQGFVFVFFNIISAVFTAAGRPCSFYRSYLSVIRLPYPAKYVHFYPAYTISDFRELTVCNKKGSPQELP